MKLIAEGKMLNGTPFGVTMPSGYNYSRAVRMYNDQKEFDLIIFLMVELVVVDGEKKTIDFFKELYCDDYLKIMEMLGSVVTPIK